VPGGNSPAVTVAMTTAGSSPAAVAPTPGHTTQPRGATPSGTSALTPAHNTTTASTGAGESRCGDPHPGNDRNGHTLIAMDTESAVDR
jgi:hypothetical protein